MSAFIRKMYINSQETLARKSNFDRFSALYY